MSQSPQETKALTEAPGHAMFVSWPRVSIAKEALDDEAVMLLIDDASCAPPQAGMAFLSNKGCRLIVFGESEWDWDYPYPDAPGEAELSNQILWMLKREAWDPDCEAELQWALKGRRLWGLRRIACLAGGDLDYRLTDGRVSAQLVAAVRRLIRPSQGLEEDPSLPDVMDEAARQFLLDGLTALRSESLVTP